MGEPKLIIKPRQDTLEKKTDYIKDSKDDNEISAKEIKKKVSDVFEERKKIKSKDDENIIIKSKVENTNQNEKKDNKEIVESREEDEKEKDEELKVETRKKLSMNDLKSSVKIKVNLEPENRIPKRKKKKIFTDEIKDELTFHNHPEAFDQFNELKEKKIADEFEERLKTEQVQDEKSIIEQRQKIKSKDDEKIIIKPEGEISYQNREESDKQNDGSEEEKQPKTENKRKMSLMDLKSSVQIKLNIEPENNLPKRKKKEIPTDEIRNELSFDDFIVISDPTNELERKKVADEERSKINAEMKNVTIKPKYLTKKKPM